MADTEIVNEDLALVGVYNAMKNLVDSENCCCCPTPKPLEPFVRPTGDCETEVTFIPCDSRITTITTGHYVYEDGMPHWHYDVGSIEDAEAWFNKEQTVTVSGSTNSLFDETKNYVVNQPNVNGDTLVHLSEVPVDTTETVETTDPVTDEAVEGKPPSKKPKKRLPKFTADTSTDTDTTAEIS